MYINPRLAQSILIYMIITSLLILNYMQAQSITSYWPHRKQPRAAPPSHQLGAPVFPALATATALVPSQIRALASAQLPRRQLMIGQHYNNFSSIVPYSIEQDDYAGSLQEDPLVEETDEHEAALLSHQQRLAGPRDDNSDEQRRQFYGSQQRQSDMLMQLRSQPAQWHQWHLDRHEGRQQHQHQHQHQNQHQHQHQNQHQHQHQHQNQHQHQHQQHQHQHQHQHHPHQHQHQHQHHSHDQQQQVGEIGDKQEQDASEKNEAKSRALLPLDSNRLILPQMQQIKSRFNQGCVGGTKCQFFAFCWMSGGSLGASCGLLMTCCVTPSRQEIQPGFYGPVVNDPYCGRSTSKINRIVGGTDASFGQFPWQAFVQVGGSRCGGALISSRHVVTAGHCVARSQHSPSSIKVTLGDYILNSDIESIPHEVFSVVEVLLHPNFRFTPQADRYDVAVLELDRTASYKDNIKPICLPQKDANFVGRVAYVAGWGALQAGSKLRPKVLQHVAVPVIENHVCEGWHRRKGIDIRIYDEMMCAGYELGQRDACQGDSGGPLMLNQFGVWYLVGIVSAGYSCAKQYQPGIYHRVSSSSDWISSNVYQQGANK